MTALRRGDFARALAKWNPDIRLLLLLGADLSGSRDLAAAAIKALGDPADPMALTDLSTDELKADPGRLPDEAASVSMFGGRRVIRVEPAGEGAMEAARLLLAAPVAGNPVVMVAGDLSKASSLRQLAEGSSLALAVISWPPTAADSGRWVQGRAAELGLRLEPGVAERLLATADNDTAILASEMEKFALFLDAAPDRPKRLKRGHLARLGADSAEEDLNRLVASVIGGEARAIERQLQLLAESSAIPALRAVARRLIQVADIRAAMDAGASAGSAVASLKPPMFGTKEAKQAIADAMPGWPASRIAGALAAMLREEARIKTPGGAGDTPAWQAVLRLGAGGDPA